jgi:hypothetical protein
VGLQKWRGSGTTVLWSVANSRPNGHQVHHEIVNGSTAHRSSSHFRYSDLCSTDNRPSLTVSSRDISAHKLFQPSAFSLAALQTSSRRRDPCRLDTRPVPPRARKRHTKQQQKQSAPSEPWVFEICSAVKARRQRKLSLPPRERPRKTSWKRYVASDSMVSAFRLTWPCP